MKKSFASDNNSGIHPEIFQALEKANQGHFLSYGEDPYTEKALQKFQEYFGEKAQVFFTFNGTAANVLSLRALVQSYHGIICADTSHLSVDECGAPENFTGCKLLPVATPDGKLSPDLIRSQLKGFGFPHHVQPKVISLAQPTEMGTVYTPEELRRITELAKEYNLFVHMDGARLANAAVSLGVEFREITLQVGIDALSFGGTKNGMMLGEAVVFFHGHGKDFPYIQKQGMQLSSKMRFISAQFLAYLSKDIWRKNALQANKMAALLAEKISSLPSLSIAQKVETNAVFAVIPKETISSLQKEYFFYEWDEKLSLVRWMTSYDTTSEDVEQFVETLKKFL